MAVLSAREQMVGLGAYVEEAQATFNRPLQLIREGGNFVIHLNSEL